LIEDGERAADGIALTGEDVQAERVKGAHGERLCPSASLSKHLHHALPHLTRGLVRERECDDRLGRDSPLDEACDSVGDYPRFSGTCTRQNEQRPIAVLDSFSLCRIETRSGAQCGGSETERSEDQKDEDGAEPTKNSSRIFPTLAIFRRLLSLAYAPG
jgi:hypothetical protein